MKDAIKNALAFCVIVFVGIAAGFYLSAIETVLEVKERTERHRPEPRDR
jgi:hypothetical protein